MVDRRRDALRFEIELTEIAPRVWREIVVPARFSFWDLHVAIQDAMSWQDSHLHSFRGVRISGDDSCWVGIPDEEDWEGLPPTMPGWHVPLLEHFRMPGDVAEYEYDFGDSWLHVVTLTAIERRVKGAPYPCCTGGARACPPEDCGGVPGYAQLLDALLDPHHPEHEEIMAWIPCGWGPETFRAEEVRFDNPGLRWKHAFLC